MITAGGSIIFEDITGGGEIFLEDDSGVILTEDFAKISGYSIGDVRIRGKSIGDVKIPPIYVGDVKIRGGAIGDVKEKGDDLPAGKNVGDVKIEGVTGVDPIRSSFQLISPGYGYKIAPKVYISGGRMSGHETVTKADGEDFDYHTIFRTTLSRAPKAHAILEGDKIASISLDSTGDSYFITSPVANKTYPQISIGGVPLKSIKLTEAGRLYKEIPRLSFVPGSGGGRGAVGECISLDIKGAVEEIELTSKGDEYTSAPEIKISNP